jgi:GT2 family glycosyltransferase
VLSSLERQSYDEFDVVVVDNASKTNDIREVVTDSEGSLNIRYVSEPVPGLARARNKGTASSRGDIVAFLDDDELTDSLWLAEIANGFLRAVDTAAVGGLILPLALDTPAQWAFEQFGGHSKGRGLEPEVFDQGSHRRQHPLFPLPSFAAGGNMAFRRAALDLIGGFDSALGAGTPACASEDTAAIADVMLAGYPVVWQPSAIVYHEHYRELADAVRQMYGYGVGLMAFYARMLVVRPTTIFALLGLAPTALRQTFNPKSLRNAGTLERDYPPAMRSSHRRGMLAGPYEYLRSRALQRRLERTATTHGPLATERSSST